MSTYYILIIMLKI